MALGGGRGPPVLAVVQRGDWFLVLELGLRLQLSLTSGRRLDGSHVSIARKNLEWLGGGSVLGGHDRAVRQCYWTTRSSGG